ncbi:F-box/LRR-repeat protein 20-like [Trifolium pratense]|uniref:F-box/LRR-repeat protein 20-like n=1 Tax=Trifolium pratense TaxID=57577 RepID=UPI001E696CA6|nr:F-box/LRR-repeat protein 20-like [Trifolium pratense]
MVSSYIPDELWESIFKFIIYDDYDYSRCSLSHVSKHFLSITNRLLFSLTLHDESTCCRLLTRFTNLDSLNLTSKYIDLDNLLIEISRFPLKLTSLNLSEQPTIPAIGLRAFSKKITTLTSLTCSHIDSISNSDLFLIAECFPLLQELNFRYPCPSISSIEDSYHQVCSSYVDGIKALSLALIKLRKVNLSGFPLNNESLFHLFNNCKLLQEVIMIRCDAITYTGLAYALRERPTLNSLSFHSFESGEFDTLNFINSLVSLKGLTCLVLYDMNISDELLYSIARKRLPLTKLDLSFCTGYSYAGILRLLTKCQRIQHLNLQGAEYLTDQHVVQLSSFLGDLVYINLSYCDELTESTLLALARKCPSLSKMIMETFGNKIVRLSDSLLQESGVYPQLKSLCLGGNLWFSYEGAIMVASIFPNLKLFNLNACTCSLKVFDLYSCPWLSEGNCQDLRKRCKVTYINLAEWSRMKLL